jgi:Flp pilus assembly protein TadG
MRQNPVSRTRKRQRGQTIILVAISLLSLLAVAALAIDVVTLYVARSEAQRAVDAAALAGAKAVADSGVTTLSPSDANLPNAVLLARSMSLAAVTAMLTANTPPINQIAGGGPTTWSQAVTFPATANPTNSNPHVTVSLTVSTLPTFFARIWGNGSATVKVTATAEAYNPANVQLNFTPIAPKGVKPWLVANADPDNGGAPFVNPLTGVVEAGGASEVVGETINLSSDCQPGFVNCVVLNDNPPTFSNGPRAQVDYVPALLTVPSVPNPNVCPPCAGATDYEQSIECADMTTSYQVLSCGGGANNVTWDNTVNPGGPGGLSELGTECLIHAVGTGLGKGQDTLDTAPWPTNPMQILAQSGPQNGNLVTTSNSIVTIPIIDNNFLPNKFPVSGQPLTVVGFMQGFIREVHGNAGPIQHRRDIEVTILNVAGCSANPGVAAPIVGGSGTSPVPVRLITGP